MPDPLHTKKFKVDSLGLEFGKGFKSDSLDITATKAYRAKATIDLPEPPEPDPDPAFVFDFSASVGSEGKGNEYQDFLYISVHDSDGIFELTKVADRYLEVGVDYELNDLIDFTDLVLDNPTCKYIYFQWGEYNDRDEWIQDVYVPHLNIEQQFPADSVSVTQYPRRVRLVIDPDVDVATIYARISASPVPVPSGLAIVDWSEFLQSHPLVYEDEGLFVGYLAWYVGSTFKYYQTQLHTEIASPGDLSPLIFDFTSFLWNYVNIILDGSYPGGFFEIEPEFDSLAAQCDWSFNDDPIIHSTPPYLINLTSPFRDETVNGFVLGTDPPGEAGSTPGPGSIALSVDDVLQVVDANEPMTLSMVPTQPAGIRLRTDHVFDALYNVGKVYLWAGYSTQLHNCSIIAEFTEGVDYEIGPEEYLDLTAAIMAHSPATDYFGLTSKNRAGIFKLIQGYLLAVTTDTPQGSIEIEPSDALAGFTFRSDSLGSVTSCYLAAWDSSNWYMSLDYYTYGKAANRGWRIYSRPAGSGSYTLTKAYVKGVDYDTTDNYLAISSAMILHTGAAREWQVYEVFDNGGGEDEVIMGMVINAAVPASTITAVGAFEFQTLNQNSANFVRIAVADADGINGTDP